MEGIVEGWLEREYLFGQDALLPVNCSFFMQIWFYYIKERDCSGLRIEERPFLATSGRSN